MKKSSPSHRDAIMAIEPYVPGKPISEVKRELGIDDVIKLASNENPLGPSPLAQEAVAKWVTQMHLYPDGYAYELRRTLAASLGVGDDQLVFGTGSDEVIRLIAEAFMSPGDEVVMATPTFSVYRSATLLMGAKPVEIPLQDYTHDLLAMAAAVNEKTKAVFVCNPNNPTGTIVPYLEIREFMKDIPPSTLVVFDEAYFEYVTDTDYPNSLALLEGDGPAVVILRTFSKAYGLAGLRIGYGVSDPETASILNRVREPFNTNAAAQVGALAALADTDHLSRSLEVNSAGKQYLSEAFAELGLEYVHTHTNFILVDVRRDCKEVFRKLLARGVIVRTGDIFGYPTKLRISIGTQQENRRFVEALRAVLAE